MDKAGQMLQCNICPGVFSECSIFLALYVRKCPALSAQKMQLDKPAKGDVVPWLSGCPAGWLAVGPCCRANRKAGARHGPARLPWHWPRPSPSKAAGWPVRQGRRLYHGPAPHACQRAALWPCPPRV